MQAWTQCEAFDQDHPDIWSLFKRFTLELIECGNERGSSDAVLHRIRWDYATSTTGQKPKINNNLSAPFARKFHSEFPEHSNFFFTRHSSSDINHQQN